MANSKKQQNGTQEEIKVQYRERNWTLKLIDKVLGRNPELKDVIIETTCLKSFAEKSIKGSLDTIADLLQDEVIKAFVVGNKHQVEKQVFENGKPVYLKNGKPKTEPKVAYSIKLIGLDISKVSTRPEYDEAGKQIGTREFRWFNRAYRDLIEQKQFEEQTDCFAELEV